MGKPIHPITVSALRHLATHGISSLDALKAAIHGLLAKTLMNMVNVNNAAKTEGGYKITAKGKARLAQVDAEEKARTQAADGAVNLSAQEIEDAITAALQETSLPITMDTLARHIDQPLRLVRPAMTTMVQRQSVLVSNTKPLRYRLPNSRAAAPRHLNNATRSAGKPSGYQCPELRRNPGLQPERFAAFDLPSRVGNSLRWPDGRITHINDPREATA